MTLRVGRTAGWSDQPSRTWVGSLALLAIFASLYFVITPGASLVDTPAIVANASVVIAIAAVGEAIVVLTGGFDLSVGAVLSLVNVVLASHLTAEGQSPLVALVVAAGLGGLCGLANGALVAFGRVPTVIATLGSSFVFAGLALFVMDEPGGEVSFSFVSLLSGSIGVVPMSALFLLVVVLGWQYVRSRPFGQAVYAIGEDPRAARMSGIRTGRTLLLAYLAAGICYGIAGASLTAQTASGDPRIGIPLTLTVFAAVVVGGIRLGGGVGSVAGAVTGALILGLIGDLLYATGISSFYTYVVTGVVLVAAVAASGILPHLLNSRAGNRTDLHAGPQSKVSR